MYGEPEDFDKFISMMDGTPAGDLGGEATMGEMELANEIGSQSFEHLRDNNQIQMPSLDISGVPTQDVFNSAANGFISKFGPDVGDDVSNDEHLDLVDTFLEDIDGFHNDDKDIGRKARSFIGGGNQRIKVNDRSRESSDARIPDLIELDNMISHRRRSAEPEYTSVHSYRSSLEKSLKWQEYFDSYPKDGEDLLVRSGLLQKAARFKELGLSPEKFRRQYEVIKEVLAKVSSFKAIQVKPHVRPKSRSNRVGTPQSVRHYLDKALK